MDLRPTTLILTLANAPQDARDLHREHKLTADGRAHSAMDILHRYTGAVLSSATAQTLAEAVVEHYGGDAARIWRGVKDASVLHERLAALPGFGDEKASIFLALLAKQLGVRPDGWEAAAGEYALEGYRSIADVVDADSLLLVRESKQAVKQAEKQARG